MARLPGRILIAALCLLRPLAAIAQPADAPAVSTRPPARHAVFVELLGKGGLWGLGYSFQLASRLALGGVASFTTLDGHRIWSASPFVTLYPLGTRRQRLFVELGPQLIHVSTPSPVPEWMGTSSTGIGAQLSTGYEYRGPLLVRVFAMGVAGKGGLAPWLGADVGWSF